MVIFFRLFKITQLRCWVICTSVLFVVLVVNVHAVNNSRLPGFVFYGFVQWATPHTKTKCCFQLYSHTAEVDCGSTSVLCLFILNWLFYKTLSYAAGLSVHQYYCCFWSWTHTLSRTPDGLVFFSIYYINFGMLACVHACELSVGHHPCVQRRGTGNMSFLSRFHFEIVLVWLGPRLLSARAPLLTNAF